MQLRYTKFWGNFIIILPKWQKFANMTNIYQKSADNSAKIFSELRQNKKKLL
jgi:hypothetical protein